MNIKIPDDLVNKNEKEIKEMILEVGLIAFSKFLVSYLKEENTFLELSDKNNLDLLEKVAIAIDSVLYYHQIVKKDNQSSPIDNILINKFIKTYSSANEKEVCGYR